MSYILEALKKSDQERRRGDVPNLQTLHIPRPVQPAARSWPYLAILFLLVALLVAMAFVVGSMQPWSSPAQVQQPATAPSPPTSAQPADIADTPATETAVDLKPTQLASARYPESQHSPVQRRSSRPPAVVSQPSTVDVTPSLDIGAVPHLSEMPELVQQAIPEMSFAGHVYSSNAEQRSVIINGHSMSEGDRVIGGLVVEQITRDGIVFNYRDQLFRMEILQDWSFD